MLGPFVLAGSMLRRRTAPPRSSSVVGRCFLYGSVRGRVPVLHTHISGIRKCCALLLSPCTPLGCGVNFVASPVFQACRPDRPSWPMGCSLVLSDAECCAGGGSHFPPLCPLSLDTNDRRSCIIGGHRVCGVPGCVGRRSREGMLPG